MAFERHRSRFTGPNNSIHEQCDPSEIAEDGLPVGYICVLTLSGEVALNREIPRSVLTDGRHLKRMVASELKVKLTQVKLILDVKELDDDDQVPLGTEKDPTVLTLVVTNDVVGRFGMFARLLEERSRPFGGQLLPPLLNA